LATNLANAVLRGSRLQAASIKDTNLWQADLSNADLSGIRMKDTHLANSTLQDAKLAAARVVRSSLKDANLTAADLTNSSLMRVDVTGADLTGATFNGARAGRVDWLAAKAPPTELPGSLPAPPPWLPMLLGCIGAALLVAALKRKARRRS